MNQSFFKSIVIILALAVIGLGVLSIKTYIDHENLTLEYEKLKDELKNIDHKYQELDNNYKMLFSERENLKIEYQLLESAYSEISNNYQQLLENYSKLNSQYEELEKNYIRVSYLALRLNKTLSDLTLELLSYCCLPYAFERVLDIDEINAVGIYVENITDPNDLWKSIENMYYWVQKKITYVEDMYIPYPKLAICERFTRICYYEYTSVKNYVQTPLYTARSSRGDCEDQAILLYAMIKYYLLNIHHEDMPIWIGVVNFHDGSRHVALFIPVGEGNLTILDPAGSYLTTDRNNTITSRLTRFELTMYVIHWLSHGNKIVNLIELYAIDPYTGVYKLVAIASITDYQYVDSK